MRTSRSRAERAERDQGEQPARGSVGASRETSLGGAAAPPALTADVLRAAQRGAGNAAAIAMIARRVRPEPDSGSEQFDTGVGRVLNSGGKPLAAPVRQDMESRFGTDFSDVRLHTGGAAARSARAIGARAYTSGSHVVLGEGGADKHTLAHELTHVVQQRQGPVSGSDTGHGFAVSDPSDRFEREAESNARRVLSGLRSANARNATPDSGPVAGQEQARVQRQGNADDDRGLATSDPVDRCELEESQAQQVMTRPAPVQRMYSSDEDDYDGDDESDIAETLENDDVLGRLIQDVRACTCEPSMKQAGRATKQVVVRHPRDQKGERAEQTLRHICIRIFNCIRYLHDVALHNTTSDAPAVDAEGDTVMAESSSAPTTEAARDSKGKDKATPKKDGPPRESEVQGMLINGRLVFATNRNRSITLLMEYLKAQSAEQPDGAPEPDLSHLMNREPSESELRTGRPKKEGTDLVSSNRRARLKIQQVYQGQRASATAEAMERKGRVEPLEAQPTSPDALDELRQKLTSDEHKGAVILLKHSTGPRANPDGTETMHAEQKLMLALESANLSEQQRGERIVVRGVKRPCKACWAMLEHYRQRDFPLDFNQEFGAFFQESAGTILTHLPHVAQPPDAEEGGNWMSEQIVTKAQDGTRVSAYAGDRAPADAETGSRGGKQTRVTAEQRPRKDGTVAYNHAQHGTGGHETESDSDVVEGSDGELTSTYPNVDLSGIRGQASAASDSEAAPLTSKRARKKNIKEYPTLVTMLDEAMGPDFQRILEERKENKTNVSLNYPPALLDMIAQLVNDEDVSMYSIARHLGVASKRLTETVHSRTTGLKDQGAGGGEAPSSSAPKKRKMGHALDSAGENRLRHAMTSDFAEWRDAVKNGTSQSVKRPSFGKRMNEELRDMKGTYTAASIGKFLGNIPERTMRRLMPQEE